MRRLLSLELIPVLLMACYSAGATDLPESLGTPMRRDGISVAENTDSFPRVWEDFLQDLQTSATPPRKISDITAILDQQPIDSGYRARIAARLAVPPPINAHPAELAKYYRNRADAAFAGGMLDEAVAASEKTVELAKATNRSVDVALMRLGQARYQAGLPSREIFREAFERSLLIDNGDLDDWTINWVRAYLSIGRATMSSLVYLTSLAGEEGDLASAHKWVVESDRYLGMGRIQFSDPHYNTALNAQSHGHLELALGHYKSAEDWYRKAIDEWQRYVEETARRNRGGALGGTYDRRLMDLKDNLARSLLRQGRVLEAEQASREELLFALQHSGKTSVDTAVAIDVLAQIMLAEGRMADAEKLYLAEIEIRDGMGIRADGAKVSLADAIALQGRWSVAAGIYESIPQQTSDSDPGAAAKAVERATVTGMTLPHVMTLYELERTQAGLTLARAIAERDTRLLGPGASETLLARGLAAIGLERGGQRSDALRQFDEIVPYLLRWETSREPVAESGALPRLFRRYVLESYLEMLTAAMPPDAVTVAFRVAESLRSSVSERTLISSTLRTGLSDPTLSDLARREQDATQELVARRASLANALALPTKRQDAAALDALRKDIEALDTAATAMRHDIAQRYPKFENLVNPAPPSIGEASATLARDEALVALYVGVHESYVWALNKDGPVAFAKVPLTRDQLAERVNALRNPLDPNVRTWGDIQPFDVVLAHELYAALLEPVASGWKGAKQLVVVPSGPLAQIPFAMLVTKPVAQPTHDHGALFSEYQTIPFLAREVAISQVPSVAALVSLRTLAPTTVSRKPFVGFGDPWFSAKQAEEARRETVATADTRGFDKRASPGTEKLASARLDALPRLPDTALEVTEIAATLHADAKADVYLGPAANEWQVRNMRLDDRQVVMFATHGLLPGDLDGLDQPALALSAPSVAKVDGDGLLTMDKILGLKLNADWVVLSACNTAAGDGAGAEAVSGLGRAFFYAGARALLVTNWTVETTSARKLTTTLFQKEAQDPNMSRAEALRQSMLSLIDGPGYVDPGIERTVASYAHPVFWAPYSLVGDGH